MSDGADNPVGTVVPVDLVAFCVGTTDAAERTADLAGATIDYSQLANQDPNAFPYAYLGSTAMRGFTSDALQPLEAGVHLHWALPDSLTRAQSNETTPLAFPAVPNRWLVTRFVIAGGTPTATSFVVESDTLNPTPPTDASLQVPVKSEGTEPDFHYLGQSFGLDDYPATPAEGARPLRDANGVELTAVANGLPSFAAYYPEGRNSFGFIDTLHGIATPAQLTYVVTGWFDSDANDPASPGSKEGIRRPLAESHGWVAEAEADYTLYSGVIHGVSWDPTRSYVLPPEEQPTIAADAAIANNPSEALAAYFRNLLHPDSVHSEQLLTAFQQGLWPRFTQSTVDALAQIAEALHDHQFRKIDSGLIYSLYLSDADGAAQQQAIDLPGPVANALNALNGAAADLLEVANHVETFQWRAFADWYRYFMTPDNQKPLIFSHFTEVLDPLWAPLQAALSEATGARDDALSGLNALLALRPDLCLRQEPGPRYWQPNEPAVLLKSDQLTMPARYGGDGDHRADGKLACRNLDALVTSVAIGGTTKAAADYAAATKLTSNSLPYLADCSALLAEACLLDPDLAAAWSNVDAGTLGTALEALLTGSAQSQWTIAAGTAPSPVEVNFWGAENPWLPIFLTWTAAWTPLPGTGAEPYDPNYFTANFAIDPTTGSFVSYTGANGAIGAQASAGAQVAPPPYAGSSVLSRKAAQNFYGQIETYLQSHQDTTLQAIAAALQPGDDPRTPFMVQPLSGFTEAMLNRQLQMQFAMTLPQGVKSLEAIRLTKAASAIVGAGNADPSAPVTYHVGPDFGLPFNPIRAGAFTITLAAVDAYGQKRTIDVNSLATAESMTAAAAPGAAYAAPRLAQPSRLLFQWLSASTGNVAEYNGHPASSPICGWLLPNHLAGGFFLYDADGRPLGSLFVAGDDVVGDSEVIWQGAPGNDADIDQPIDVALAAANPQLSALARHLKGGSVTDFQAFYQAVDQAHGSINPANLATDAGLAIFIGRPVALVQAALRLDLQGRPYLSQNSACLESSGWVDTDAGLGGVTFPVVLGDIDRLDDGLIGYYRGLSSGYDLDTFFSEVAVPGATGAVVQPGPTNLLLKPTPAQGEPDPPAVAADSQPVLMLIDPRAPVHAVMGILPTQSLLVPPDLASNALSTLEFSFLAAPVLQAASGLALPVPRENGYDVSFLQQRAGAGNARSWFPQPDIGPSVAAAIADYTPQTLVEGWLRLNPTVLTATLVNASGQPLAKGGATQAMTLSLVNRKPAPITFTPGTAAPEGTPATGSIFYVHFGALVAPEDVAAIGLAEPRWTFTLQNDPIYGAYFAATAAADVVLASAPAGTDAPADSRIDIAVTNLKAATGLVQAHLFVDYYDVGGISDGVAMASVTVG